MSDPVTALGGAAFTGAVTVTEAPLQGMVTLRGDLSDSALQQAVTALTGAAMPDRRSITTAGDRAAAWMSPDELLLLLPYVQVQKALGDLDSALGGQHALALDVSDARAMFHIAGNSAAEVLAKLCPVDLERLPAGEMRRTRAAQVPVALWQDGQGRFSLICFRSVAQYVFDLLKDAAGSARSVGYFVSGAGQT